MHQIIQISKHEFSGSLKQTVNARELHAFLESKQDFSTWIKNRISDYGFLENQDFVIFHNSMEKGRPRIEYAISLDMAKELSMVERNEKGKQARQYFIECEKQIINNLSLPNFANPAEAARAWAIEYEAKQKAEQLALEAQKQVEQLAPKAAFADAVSASEAVILIRDLAKLIKQNGVDIGERRLFDWLRKSGYLTQTNLPTQRSMNQGLFAITETLINTPTGSRVSLTAKVTGKGQTYFIEKFLNGGAA